MADDIDIMATCVDVSQATYPTNYRGHTITPNEGTSLIPVLVDNQVLDRSLFFEHQGNRAVRRGAWKLVSRAYPDAGRFRQTNPLPIKQWELFNSEQDRTETIDLSAQHPQLVKELSEQWQRWATRTNTVPLPDFDNRH